MQTLHSAMSAEQRAFYQQEGYLVIPRFLEAKEADELRETFMSQNAKGLIPNLSDTATGFLPEDPLARYPRMVHPHRHTHLPVGRLARRILLDRRMEAIVSELLCEEPVAALTMFYFKPPGARGQSLHQDNFYLRVQPGTCLGVWIAVDDSTLENGCMIVAPRSHQLPVLCPEAADTSLFFTEEQVAIPQGLQETPIPMQAGDALFFNGSLIHGSYPNRTPDQFRRAFTCHYVPRASAEASHWFNPYFAFDGSEVWIKEAEGGGPCGITQERINAFHG